MSERYLPKPSIEKFDGDPLDYWGYVNRFQIHIASKVAVDHLRLVYLLQHCSEKVYEKVRHFAGNIDVHTGYNLVWQELFRRYGQAHVISRCCEERLLKVSKISQHDVDGLENLAILLKRCQASLMTNNALFAVDSVNFLAASVQKLPAYVQHNWINTALQIEQRCGRLARFNDFVEFVSKESIVSHSTYHAVLFPSNQREKKDLKGANRAKVFFAATSNLEKRQVNRKSKDFKSDLVCVCCAEDHELSECSEFQERKGFVIDKKLCLKIVDLRRYTKVKVAVRSIERLTIRCCIDLRKCRMMFVQLPFAVLP